MKTRAHHVLTATSLTSIVGLLLVAGSAQATQSHSNMQNATGACQAALPFYDGFIRKRLMYVSNEGNATAVATCSLMGTSMGANGPVSITSAYVNLINLGAAPVNVTCTLSDGYFGSNTVYLAKTVTLAANSKINDVRWTAANNGGKNFLLTANITCALEPQTAIGMTGVYWDATS
jgi:hypothetical protein